MLSIVVLYRGHNLPGGGFIGGLIAASAVLLLALSEGWDHTNKKLFIQPITLMIVGAAMAAASGFWNSRGCEFYARRMASFL